MVNSGSRNPCETRVGNTPWKARYEKLRQNKKNVHKGFLASSNLLTPMRFHDSANSLLRLLNTIGPVARLAKQLVDENLTPRLPKKPCLAASPKRRPCVVGGISPNGLFPREHCLPASRFKIQDPVSRYLIQTIRIALIRSVRTQPALNYSLSLQQTHQALEPNKVGIFVGKVQWGTEQNAVGTTI